MPAIRNLVLLCPLLLFYQSFSVTSSSDDYTCVAGNFTVGQPGSVTCHLGPDVHKAGYHFEIVRYPFHAAASHIGEDVLRCHRLRGELKCQPGMGYKFDEKVEDNVTLDIPNVTHDQAGRYACQLIPADNRKKRLCILNVLEAEPIPETLLHAGQSSDKIVVLAVFVGLFFTVIVILVLLFIFRKRTRRRRLTTLFARSRENRSKAANGTATKNHRDEDEEVTTSFMMPPIVPYPESEEEDQPDDNDEKKGFDGDEEDAEKPYKINISLDYRVDSSDNAGESTGKRRYSGDEDDKGRSPVKFTIQPYDENDADGQVDQVGSPPPISDWQRRPYRRAWLEGPSTHKV